jgi:hypothetical protein
MDDRQSAHAFGSVPMYSLDERDRRWRLARSFMEREGLDALLVFSEHEDAGPAAFCFDTWFTNDRPGAIVVFPRVGEPAALVWHAADQVEYAQRGDVLWITPENRRVGHHDSGGVADLLTEFGLARATVGVVGLEPYLPFLPEGVVPTSSGVPSWRDFLVPSSSRSGRRWRG